MFFLCPPRACLASVLQTMSVTKSEGADDNIGAVDDEADFRSDAESECHIIPETADLETMRRELSGEINELEWEFKQVKEALYLERISQIDQKLQQLKSSDEPELKRVCLLVDEAYQIRKQVDRLLVFDH